MVFDVPVTVIIPFYNDAHQIERALASVQQQTARPTHVLIVNDASLPAEAEMLESIALKFQDWELGITHSSVNRGPSSSRNLAWDQADTKYVAFLDSDDSWHPDKLRSQVEILEEHNFDLLGTRSNNSQSTRKQKLFTVISGNAQVLRNRFATSSVMVRNTHAHRFDTSKRYSEDNDLWCRIILSGASAGIVNRELTFYHKPPRSREGASGRYIEMFRGQLSVYSGLRRDGLISHALWCVANISAVARFGRRMMLVSTSLSLELARRKIGRS